jgi:chromosome partitioning protein
VIVAVMADKGGVGKTTGAHNLAAEVACRGTAVLLIDADKQADLTELVGLIPEPNAGVDAILRQSPTPSAARFIREVSPCLSLIGTHPQMRKADRELAQRTRREYVLDAALEPVLAEYGLVIVDVGHSEMVQLNVLAVADMLVIPTTPAKLDADHVMNMIDEAEAMRRDLRLPSLITPGRVVVSITRRSTNAGIETTVLELLKERFAHVLAPAVVPFTPRVIEASALHMNLREYRDTHGSKRDRTLSIAVDAYAALADHVMGQAQKLAGVA